MQEKAISELLESGEFVIGWVHDERRETLNLSLKVDGVTRARGLSGHALSPGHLVCLASPPALACGFAIPIPAELRRRGPCLVTVAVDEWRGIATAPEASLLLRPAACFGRVEYHRGFFTGWVGFPDITCAKSFEELPPLIVSDASGHAVLAVSLGFPAEPLVKEGARAVAAFKLDAAHPALPDAPRFWCEGAELLGSPVEALPEVVGAMEIDDERGIFGWALDRYRLDRTLELELFIDDRCYCRFYPNVSRPEIARELGLDIQEIGLAGFRLGLPPWCRDGLPHRYSVRCARTGKRLTGDDQCFTLTKGGLPYLDSATIRGAERSQMRRERPPDVSVIILNRNGEALLSALFESWLKHNTCACEMIVVDHASTDGSRALIERWKDRLPLKPVLLDINDSFSASCNRGAHLARGKHLLFLNNDIVWLQDALPQLVSALDMEAVGAVGLKLLKAPPNDAIAARQPEVQHLGVRFKLAGDQYWPYEIDPENEPETPAWSAIEIPAVTGAALLTRREDFLAIGGFDESYFYGYEDVEFCLRLQSQHGKKIICRNDLVALHRHGYTRLSGRDIAVSHRLADNFALLATHFGRQLKRDCWHELFIGQRFVGNETLTIGLAIDSPATQRSVADESLARNLHARFAARWPWARLVLLTPDRGWRNVHGVHVLIAASPRFDLRQLQEARADLIRIAWGDEMLAHSRWMPWWSSFDACVMIKTAAKGMLPVSDLVPCLVSTDTAPLGLNLDANSLPVRVAIRVPDAVPAPGSDDSPSWQAARSLQGKLRKEGILCHLVPRERWEYPERVADIDITLHDRCSGELCLRTGHVANIVWLLDGPAHVAPARLAVADAIWETLPAAATMRRQIKRLVSGT